jgi:hypothetical protein
MKFFISHKFTGLSWDDMDSYLNPLCMYLQSYTYKVFCSLYLEDWFKEQWWDAEKIYERCCEQQDTYDVTLAVFRSDQDSYGMNLELERAKIGWKKYIVLYRDGLQNHEWMNKYISHAHQIISYSSYKEYLELLKTTTFLFT